VGNAPVTPVKPPIEKALKRRSIVERLREMGLRHFPKPIKRPLRAFSNTGSTPTPELNHTFCNGANMQQKIKTIALIKIML